MENIHLYNCPVCEGSDFVPLMTCKDHYASGEKYEIVRCQNCNFRFTQDFPDEDFIGKYYETKEYISHSNTDKGVINKLYHYVREYMIKRKCALGEKVTGLNFGRVLDIGCGTGFFLNAMKKDGWITLGIEKNQTAIEFAQKQFNLDIKTDLWDIDYEDAFDLITMWHVLEHIQDLPETFVKLRELLRKNGRLIVALPNSDSFDARFYKEYWGAYDVPRHLWHFTPETFRKIARKEGFRIEEIYPMPFDAFYVSMLSEKYKGSKIAFVKGMIVGSFAWISSIGKPRNSSSVIYILKKI